MKLLELRVEGFRSLRNVVWKPGDLNIVIGPNAGGKSNLLKVLELISESAKGRLSDYVYREGGFRQIAWDNSAEKIEIQLESGFPENGISTQYSFDMISVPARNSFFVDRESYGVRNSGEFVPIFSRERQLVEIGGTYRDDLQVIDTESFLSKQGRVTGIDSRTKRDGHEFTEWVFHQYFRTDPKATVRSHVVAGYELCVSSDGENLIQYLSTLYTDNFDFRDEVNSAMIAAFGDSFQELTFPSASDQHIQLRLKWKSLSRSHASEHLSDGTLRFIYLIAILANPDPPPLIAIDEPETGLHPRMLPIIASLAATAASRTQVILTTHSPEFLSAFGEDKPTVTFVECTNGETQLKQPTEEALKYWLEKYSLGDLYVSGQLEAML